MLNSIWISEKK